MLKTSISTSSIQMMKPLSLTAIGARELAIGMLSQLKTENFVTEDDSVLVVSSPFAPPESTAVRRNYLQSQAIVQLDTIAQAMTQTMAQICKDQYL